MFAVAEKKGVYPTDLRPLADIVDPEELDALVTAEPGDRESEHHPIEVRFSYEGCGVVVQGNGDLTVEDPPSNPG